MRLQQLFVYSRTVVKSVQLGHRCHLTQVAVPLVVVGQQHQMRYAFGIHRGFIGHGARGHIAFTTDNGIDPRFDALLIKLEHVEHGAVIGNGHRAHAEFSGTFKQLVDANGAVEQTVHGVHVEMNEILGRRSHL